MRSLFISPHNDDAILFGSFTLLKHRPHVIVPLKSDLQEMRGTGITSQKRELEDILAFEALGLDPWGHLVEKPEAGLEQWEFSDAKPDWEQMEFHIRRAARDFDTVFAPSWEDGGHEQHNEIARICERVCSGTETPIFHRYLTYRRGHGKTIGKEVKFEPHWPMLKLKALACYESQIKEKSTAYWFIDSGLREYML